MMTQEIKRQAHEVLARRFKELYKPVNAIEPRLSDYFAGLVADPEYHNGYELLCAIKFLRLLRTYEFNERKVRQVLRLREGEWRINGKGRWEYIRGGIKQPLTTGDKVLRWEPFQVYILSYIYGPQAWVDTELTSDEKETLLLTERINPDTDHIEDLRRLCTEFTLYGPRKIDKTGISAFIAQEHFMLEDNNSETYCCANSSDQSKILYKRIKHGLEQLDREGKRIHITETVCDWNPEYHSVRNSSIRPLSAGGKTKDGMAAQVCCADEYGSASYTNGKSDMKRLIDVTESSMGPRREPLTVITTTAGRVTEGPFMTKLDSLHSRLIEELKYDTGEKTPDFEQDRMSCLLLEPDPWECEDIDAMLESKEVRRKINPMLGKIVQHSFYDGQIAKAREDNDLEEVISKLYNVYYKGSTQRWISGDRIRPLQIDRRITDCKWSEDWNVFVGMDFSGGDDLFAITYLAVRLNPETGNKEFFADFDAWILEAALKESPNRLLFEKWIEQGHLHLMPGEVFYNEQAIDALIAKNQQGINMVLFGYDPAQSIDPINNLKAWLQSLGIEPKTVLSMVVPVRQHALAQNPSILELETLIKAPEQFIHFSNNPMWPWLFTNALTEKKNDLRRLTKGKPQDKIDPVAALINCVYLFDLFNGNIQQ